MRNFSRRSAHFSFKDLYFASPKQVLSHLAIEEKYISLRCISSGRNLNIFFAIRWLWNCNDRLIVGGRTDGIKEMSQDSVTLSPPQITARLAFSVNAEPGLRLSSFLPKQTRNFVFSHRTVFFYEPLFANTGAVCTVSIKAAVIWTQVLCYLHRRHRIPLFVFVISRKIFYSLKFAGRL